MVAPCEAVRVEELRVVVRHLVAQDLAEWAPHDAEENRKIGHGPCHRARRVLAVRDGDDAVLRDQAERRLQSEHEVVAGRTDNRTVGFGADGRGTEVCRRRDRGARARAARIEAQKVRIACLATARAPAVEVQRRKAAKVGPLRQVGLAEDDCAGGSEPRDERRITRHPATDSASDPAVVSMVSSVAMLSLTRIGMPWSGPRSCPASVRRRASRLCRLPADSFRSLRAVTDSGHECAPDIPWSARGW